MKKHAPIIGDQPTGKNAETRAINRVYLEPDIRALVLEVGDIEYANGFTNTMTGGLLGLVNDPDEEMKENADMIARAINWELALLALSFLKKVPTDREEWLKRELYVILHGERSDTDHARFNIEKWCDERKALRKREREQERQEAFADIRKTLAQIDDLKRPPFCRFLRKPPPLP